MTNIIPQAEKFNSGLWLMTEELTNCYRFDRPTVHGGVIYTNGSNDYFVKSHGIKTPDFMWKVLVIGSKAVGWYFPNVNELSDDLDDYRMTVREIEARLNDGRGKIKIPEELKDQTLPPS
jgi:endonuclease G, mitochondrial